MHVAVPGKALVTALGKAQAPFMRHLGRTVQAPLMRRLGRKVRHLKVGAFVHLGGSQEALGRVLVRGSVSGVVDKVLEKMT